MSRVFIIRDFSFVTVFHYINQTNLWYTKSFRWQGVWLCTSNSKANHPKDPYFCRTKILCPTYRICKPVHYFEGPTFRKNAISYSSKSRFHPKNHVLYTKFFKPFHTAKIYFFQKSYRSKKKIICPVLRLNMTSPMVQMARNGQKVKRTKMMICSWLGWWVCGKKVNR